MIRMQATMNTAMIAEAIGRLTFMPPCATGLPKRSPTVAPSGRVRINVIQNSVTRDTPVQNQVAATIASAAPNTNAPPT